MQFVIIVDDKISFAIFHFFSMTFSFLPFSYTHWAIICLFRICDSSTLAPSSRPPQLKHHSIADIAVIFSLSQFQTGHQPKVNQLLVIDIIKCYQVCTSFFQGAGITLQRFFRVPTPSLILPDACPITSCMAVCSLPASCP